MKRDNRLCHGVGGYCSARLPIIRTCIEDHRDLLLLQLAPVAHHQRTGSRATRPRLGRRPGPPTAAASRSRNSRALDLSRMDLHRVLCGDRAHVAQPRRPAAARPAEGQQLLQPMTSITAIRSVPRRHPRSPRSCSARCSPCQGQAQTTQRIPVSEIKPLLALCRRARSGARLHQSRRRLRAPPLRRHHAHRDRRATLHALPQPGCARLEVTTRQRDVLEQGKRADQELRWQVSFCRDGSFPEKR